MGTWVSRIVSSDGGPKEFLWASYAIPRAKANRYTRFNGWTTASLKGRKSVVPSLRASTLPATIIRIIHTAVRTLMHSTPIHPV